MKLFTVGTMRTAMGSNIGRQETVSQHHGARRSSIACIKAVFATLLLACLPQSTGAMELNIVYARGTLGAWADPDGSGKPIANLYVASRLRILERKAGWLRVDARGWNREGAEQVVYTIPGKRILTLSLRRAEIDRLRALETIVDPDTDIAWNGVALEAWIEDKDVTPDLGTIWKEAWDLFATRCTVCHQRRVPHHYTANQWVSLLKVMGPRTGLPKDRQRLILTFLQHHARDTVDKIKN